jgi:glycosyltransferase involved in cell wall biosynthesis
MKPGIVIAHDICMHNFMRGYYIVHQNAPKQYEKILHKQYGREADRILQASNSVEEWNKLDLLKYHFSEPIFQNVLGVVVHSDYHKKFLEKFYHGPILVTPLLYMNEQVEVDEAITFQGYDEKKINILTVGVVNPNKHIDLVIEVLGKNSDLSKQINYTVIGSMENRQYAEKLERMIRKYSLEKTVHLLGYVEDRELDYYYQYADIVTNLRLPALEGGSASLVEQMLSGKAVIVTNTGVYADIPDDCVFKIDSTEMLSSLEKTLRMLVNAQNVLEETGNRARAYAENKFSSEQYIENFCDFLNAVVFTLPLQEVIQVCKPSMQCIGRTKIKEILAGEIEALYS